MTNMTGRKFPVTTPPSRRGVLVFALMLASSGAAAFTVDGALKAGEGYSTGLEVSFTVDSVGTVGGGFVAFGEDASGQYLYFSEPRGFVDNTYGSGETGWGSASHPFSKLRDSDKAGFKFFTNNGDLEVLVDYLATATTKDSTNPDDFGSGAIGNGSTSPHDGFTADKNDGKIVSTTGSADGTEITSVATSLEYNLRNFDTNTQGLNVLTDSPDTVGSTGGTGSTGGSEPADYAIAGSAAYQAEFADWIFDVGYEVSFAPGTFDSTAWANPLAGGSPGTPSGSPASMIYGTTAGGSVIASPSKLGENNPDSITVSACLPGSTSPACNLGGGGGGVGVPEPASLALLSLGLIGFAGVTRRRASR